jgi:Mn2+/Fe2+ NRAMP family transporter
MSPTGQPPPGNTPPTGHAIAPPTRILQIAMHAGPGLIVAGSIVGSGELIATTKTGAEAGFSLLWLIILGCVVKVFTQIELGRYALQSGKTTLAALDEVPGPRIRGRGNWLVWYWLLMWVASISQLGGIVGGVGQSLAISVPISQIGVDYNGKADAAILETLSRFDKVSREVAEHREVETQDASANLTAAQLQSEYEQKYSREVNGKTVVSTPSDVLIWSVLVTLVTSVMLVVGRYGLVQSLSTALVGMFTLLTIINTILVQQDPTFQITAQELWSGLSMSLPSNPIGDARPLVTALATFGIIGVGAAELVAYPYWCLEKGYARHAGVNDGSQAWADRAKGWMRVMRFDAWGSMVVYTFTTVAFYLLGAAVLHRVGLNPAKDDMVRTLAVMFVPVFSDWAATVFLFGAFAVLYSTFFVANAGHARVFSDAMRVVGWIDNDEETREKWVRRLSGFFPLLCLAIFIAFPNPTKLVLFSGVMQGIMLPMLAGAALYLRYHRCTELLTPSRAWDIALWISAAAMLVTGGWTAVTALLDFFSIARV